MLQSATLAYIEDLTKNNNKPWFDENRRQFEEAKADFETLVKNIILSFGKVDPDIAPLEAKNCIFRQYRDVRFSKDKTPYKHHMGASFDRGGKKSGFAGYYLHIQPGNKSMAGGGIWMPEAAQLKKIRQEIDYGWEEFSSIISEPAFTKIYGALEEGAFKLSREPKGYDKENPAIEILKLKSVVAIQTLTDDELVSTALLKKVLAAFTALMPLIKFINRSLE
ncbi:DUF2461 domain-containing protein [Segetibacter sp.]|jgi:uncharacterized protein (TIGR02453 family)|uniref:DUF2461 domain-containing protein n=1 Tax=Segetibacter sp. TaxID=2231182 RepID=UPI002633825C|nr:DUF2461 domain-containing protein [Segetibacter sp.]MCW3080688.1 hypothetical protein [Segetibacter sp.]